MRAEKESREARARVPPSANRFLVLLVSLVLSSSGCASNTSVARIVDGRPIAGRYIEAEAYAAFLRGVLAEGRGDVREALVAYEEAAARDDDEPETFARIAELLCKTSPGDARAIRALDRALTLDPNHARAWQARATCALASRDHAQAVRAAARAGENDPRAVSARVLLARGLDDRGQGDAARAVLVALTNEHRHEVAAWDALAAWAESKHDGVLLARAWAEIARLAPHRRAEAGARAVSLAGEGLVSAARSLAAAAVDAGSGNGGRGVDATCARLAIDQAILAGDADLAELRATRARVSLVEVAGRAWVLGETKIAKDLAATIAAADPKSAGARMVLALVASDAHDPAALARAFHGAERGQEPVPAPVALPFALRLAQLAGQEAARAQLEGLSSDPVDQDDVLIVPVAVDLAAMGVLRDDDLPPNARVELAARRGEAPKAAAPQTLDPRHRLLALVLAEPASDEALALARRLAGSVGRDPIVTFATTRIAIARGRADVELGKLLSVGPTDPLLLAVAVDVAQKTGNTEALGRARARLTAVARTPAERARVSKE
jgi:hypothetical protein